MITFTIPGMTCGGCAASVRKALAAVPGAGAVTVDLATKEVRVAGDADAAALRAALAAAGFEAAAP